MPPSIPSLPPKSPRPPRPCSPSPSSSAEIRALARTGTRVMLVAPDEDIAAKRVFAERPQDGYAVQLVFTPAQLAAAGIAPGDVLIATIAKQDPPPAAPASAPRPVKCPACGATAPPDRTRCPSCKTSLLPKPEPRAMVPWVAGAGGIVVPGQRADGLRQDGTILVRDMEQIAAAAGDWAVGCPFRRSAWGPLRLGDAAQRRAGDGQEHRLVAAVR